MNLQYTHLYILCIWTLTNVGCHAKKNDNLVKRNETKKEKDVKMLLLNPQHLIISRAIYTNHDYPLCVRSRLKKFVEVGYNHNVSYFERGYQNETHGRRYYRNAFYYVQHVGQVLLFVASAFTERHHVDPLVSGSYKVLYANPVCFVAATNPRSDVTSTFNESKCDSRSCTGKKCMTIERLESKCFYNQQTRH
ncbi:uncharacterized protein LOC119179883 isoform X3 [Rhipicephalus microplus]|uniref:uncharacterized protein LOC119179883 isoform X3 n=1 Tax=Rhipicephalus microplus TaxID=6941 RepID=UPI003F6C154C